MAYSAFEHLAKSLLLSRWRASVWVAMAIYSDHTAYFDESRIDGSHPFPVMAGFWADINIWEMFDAELRKHLSTNKPKNQLAKKFLQQNPVLYAEMFRKYGLQPIYGVIEKSVIDAIQDKSKTTPFFYSAYTNCAYLCCELLDKHALEIRVQNPIKVICDSGSEHQYLFDRAYKK